METIILLSLGFLAGHLLASIFKKKEKCDCLEDLKEYPWGTIDDTSLQDYIKIMGRDNSLRYDFELFAKRLGYEKLEAGTWVKKNKVKTKTKKK